MLTSSITHLPDGTIELTYAGAFTVEDWRGYQKTMLELLNNSPQPLYILSNFTGIDSFSRDILPEVGTAPHLSHPNLGMLVLLGGSALQNFVMQLTQLRARQTSRDSNMRIQSDRAKALELLAQARAQHPSDQPRTDVGHKAE